MSFIKKIFFAAFLFSSLIVNAIAASDGDSSIKANLEEAKAGLGEIKNISKMADNWLFISGSEDSFIVTENGRFSIAAQSDALVMKDLWTNTDITYAEYSSLKDTFPIAHIARQVGVLPLALTLKEGQKIKFSLFVIAGDEHSSLFIKENEMKLAEQGVHLYILPGESLDLFYKVMCSSMDWKMEFLKGLDAKKDISECDKSVVNNAGTKNLALANLLGVVDAPFIIVHKDWAGTKVNTKIFKVLTNE